MRVTAETKAATRQRILEAAQRQFAQRGYEATTTRDIAQAAEIAVGTLFNYFPTKEALAVCLVGAASEAGQRDIDMGQSEAESLAEELFGFVATSLRKLRSLRSCLVPLLETTLSPLSSSRDEAASSLRTNHLESVRRLAGKHGQELTPLALQLYWTLYTGVLAFWAQDTSRKQESTLALLDQSLQMFVGWLENQSERSESSSRKRG